MNRKREQADMIYQFGCVLGPLERVVADPTRFDMDEKKRIAARFLADARTFTNLSIAFCEAEPGHLYARERQLILQTLDALQSAVMASDNIEDLGPTLQTYSNEVIEHILSIPVPADSAIHDAQTPFSTYCLVKDLCSTVRQQIVWLDRYFDQTVFHRFFSDTPVGAQITLVTLPAATLRGRDATRRGDFMDVSRLFAAERGPQGYRLIENGNFHDRWLRCDDRLSTLGGSIKDLDRGPFTITRLNGTPENQRHFDDAVAQGIEVFGPNQPNHP